MTAALARASRGRQSAPNVSTECVRIPASAPVGPVMLKAEPPSTQHTRPLHTAVMMPALGLDCAATAREMDSGTLMRATVLPAVTLATNESSRSFDNKGEMGNQDGPREEDAVAEGSSAVLSPISLVIARSRKREQWRKGRQQ